MVEHNNGIALLFNRLDNKMFQDVVFPKAKGILFMKGRIKFHREDGTIGESPGCGPHGELILEACDKAAELAVTYADALIKELK